MIFIKSKYLLKVEGMNCGHCTGAVEAEFAKIKGVKAKADVKSGEVLVSGPKGMDKNTLCDCVVRAGFKVLSFEAK